jgi:hypothetical protein
VGGQAADEAARCIPYPRTPTAENFRLGAGWARKLELVVYQTARRELNRMNANELELRLRDKAFVEALNKFGL